MYDNAHALHVHSLSCSVGEFALPTSALAIVSHNGNVKWVPHLTMTSHCNMNPALYPFDRHTCSFSFSSWVYNSFELEVDFRKDIKKVSAFIVYSGTLRTDWAQTGDLIAQYVFG